MMIYCCYTLHSLLKNKWIMIITINCGVESKVVKKNNWLYTCINFLYSRELVYHKNLFERNKFFFFNFYWQPFIFFFDKKKKKKKKKTPVLLYIVCLCFQFGACDHFRYICTFLNIGIKLLTSFFYSDKWYLYDLTQNKHKKEKYNENKIKNQLYEFYF
jgi:hypothetical protein